MCLNLCHTSSKSLWRIESIPTTVSVCKNETTLWGAAFSLRHWSPKLIFLVMISALIKAQTLFLLFILPSFPSFLHKGEKNAWYANAFDVKSVVLCCLTVQKLHSDSCLLYLQLLFALCCGTKCVAACIYVAQIWVELCATPAIFLYTCKLALKLSSCMCLVSCFCSRIIHPVTHLHWFLRCYHAYIQPCICNTHCCKLEALPHILFFFFAKFEFLFCVALHQDGFCS